MKKFVTLVLMVALMAPLFAQQKKNLSAMFSYSTFCLADKYAPYVETYLQFDAWSLNFAKLSDGSFRPTVEVLMVLRQGDSVVRVKKYDLNGPSVKSPEEDEFVFFDLQRFSLDNGIYDMELSVKDKLSDSEPFVMKDKLVVFYEKDKPALSSLQLMSSATKNSNPQSMLARNGYDMMPYINDFVPAQISELNVYYEIYNIDQEVGSKALMSYIYVEQQETGRHMGGAERIVRHKQGQKQIPVYTTVDISKVPSGNYNLVVKVNNRDNQTMLYKKIPFFRSNPAIQLTDSISDIARTFAGLITDEGELDYYLDALYPIASDYELQQINELLKRPALEEKQSFFYHFWCNASPMDPEGRWHEYKKWLLYVDATYSYPKTPGYRTDRGMIYLKYGPPDFIRDEKNFVGALNLGGGTQLMTQMTGTQPTQHGHIYYLPYQLWRYNQIPNNDPNRVFLFWDEFRSGYYKLLNSNARGHVQEFEWERRLCQQQLNEGQVGEVGQQFERGY